MSRGVDYYAHACRCVTAWPRIRSRTLLGNGLVGKPETLPLRAKAQRNNTLPKAPSGIPGLDEITLGGLPRGRPTLVCGSAGCGKTLFAMEFLLRGATEFGEPGVFMAFEETEQDLS